MTEESRINKKSVNSLNFEILNSLEHNKKLIKRLNEQRHDDRLYDVVLVSGVDRKKVYAHRAILIAASDYFQAMFTSSLQESTAKEIKLENIHGDDLENLVTFCYTGEAALHEEKIETLLSASHLLQINDVVVGCCNFLERQIDPSNCIGIAVFAEQLGCKDLMEVAKEYICKYFTKVIQNEEFLKLNPEQLEEILKSDKLNVECEEEIFHSLMTWVDHDTINRKTHIGSLLKYVRLEFVSPDCLLDQVQPICFQNHCEELFVEAIKYQLLPKRRQKSGSHPRKSYDKSLFILGILNECYATIESYCPSKKEWTVERANIKLNQTNVGMTIIGENLIIIGGKINGNASVKVECLNLNTMCSRSLLSLNGGRYDCAVAVLGQQIYVIGGRCSGYGYGNNQSFLQSVERCVSMNEKWHRVAELNVGRCSAGVAEHEGNIYVVGGCNNNFSYLSTVECYDPGLNKWFIKASLGIGRSGCGVVSAHGFLYAVGGNTKEGYTKSVERYEAKSNTWSIISSLNETKSFINCALSGERILAIGESVESFDLKTNKWTVDSNLNFPYNSFYAFCASKKIFLMKCLSKEIQKKFYTFSF